MVVEHVNPVGLHAPVDNMYSHVAKGTGRTLIRIVEFPISIDRRLEAALAVGDHKTSMLQDREAGKPLEVDCMTGAVIEIADMLPVPVPYTRAVHACIKALDELLQASDRMSLGRQRTAG